MFLLGILSLLQIVLFPGLILIKILKVKTSNLIQLFLFSMGLSLYLNYLIVCLLTSLNIYTPASVYVLFFFEALALFYLGLKGRIALKRSIGLNDFYNIYNKHTRNLAPVHKTVFIISCIIILFFISLIPVNMGTTLYFNDAIINWNRWATNWASNGFPERASHYPQLFSANLSLCYVFTQNTALHLFPKAIMPMFVLGILFIFFDLALVRRSLAHLTGLILYTVILFVFYSLLFAADCNADIPTSFFGFLAFYTIIRQDSRQFDVKTALLVILFASAAANTKMAGLYILGMSFLWVLYSIYANKKAIPKKEILTLIIFTLLIIAGNLFWYIIKPQDMYSGLNQSPFLSDSYWLRFTNVVDMLLYSLGLPLIVFFGITLFSGLYVRESGYIIILVVAPVLLLWTFFFSYDFRNMSIAVPFIAYASAYGTGFIYRKIIKDNAGNLIPASLRKLSGNKSFVTLLVILSAAGIFLMVGTDSFFNWAMKSALILSRVYFRSYRMFYTSELGYYQYVRFYIDTLQVLSCLLLVMFMLRKTNLKILYISIIMLAAAAVSSFTLLKNETLYQRQFHDEEMTAIRNVHQRIFIFSNYSGKGSRIITNCQLLSGLVVPEGVQFTYISNSSLAGAINNQGTNDEPYCLLIDKSRLSRETSDYIAQSVKAKRYILNFDSAQFIFLQKGK